MLKKLKTLISKTLAYFKESYLELKKVKWPTLNLALEYTLIVFLISFIVGIYLGILDFIFSTFFKKLVEILK